MIHGSVPPTDPYQEICAVLDEVRDMLSNKNRKYGNNALAPRRVFSTASPIEQLLVRIDDKLSRFANRQSDEDKDVLMDLVGYLVLLIIALRKEGMVGATIPGDFK